MHCTVDCSLLPARRQSSRHVLLRTKRARDRGATGATARKNICRPAAVWRVAVRRSRASEPVCGAAMRVSSQLGTRCYCHFCSISGGIRRSAPHRTAAQRSARHDTARGSAAGAFARAVARGQRSGSIDRIGSDRIGTERNAACGRSLVSSRLKSVVSCVGRAYVSSALLCVTHTFLSPQRGGCIRCPSVRPPARPPTPNI